MLELLACVRFMKTFNAILISKLHSFAFIKLLLKQMFAFGLLFVNTFSWHSVRKPTVKNIF